MDFDQDVQSVLDRMMEETKDYLNEVNRTIKKNVKELNERKEIVDDVIVGKKVKLIIDIDTYNMLKTKLENKPSYRLKFPEDNFYTTFKKRDNDIYAFEKKYPNGRMVETMTEEMVDTTTYYNTKFPLLKLIKSMGIYDKEESFQIADDMFKKYYHEPAISYMLLAFVKFCTLHNIVVLFEQKRLAGLGVGKDTDLDDAFIDNMSKTCRELFY